jgi:formate dehydrogenase major subunit
MMRVILDEGLHNRAFTQQRTAGLGDLAASLVDLSLTEAAAITGVPASSIVQAARAYARAPAGAIVYAMGVTQHTTGTETVAACANLALLCGHVGRPGAGLFPLRGQNNVQGACDMGALPDVFPGYQKVDDPDALAKFAAAWQGAIRNPKSEIRNLPGLTVVEMMHAAAQGRIKGMYIMGENPVVSDPNAGEVRKALRNLDFLVVQDIFLSETAELADVVLPAAAWAEKEGSYTSTERRVQWSQKAVEPPGEARPDWQILCEIGTKAGTGGNSGEPGTRWNYSSPADILAEIVTVTPQYAGITAERLQKQVGGILWPCPTPEHPGTDILYQERFATADGRARFAPVRYRPPVEAVSVDYPLTLTTGRIGTHYNTGAMTRRSASLSRYAPDPFVEVNPQDAARLGLVDGEWATLRTARGQVQVRVTVAERMARGTVFAPFHFPGINDLTLEALDPAAKIPEFKVAACRIDEKENDDV